MSHTTLVKTVQIKSESALIEMAKELRRMGIDVELVKDAVPRLYYKDQINRTLVRDGKKMQYHKNVEECDYVLKVKAAHYDVGFLKDEDGNYVPLFDDFPYPSPYSNPHDRSWQKPLKEILGTKVPQNCAPGEMLSYSIGKALQAYSLCAATEACTEAGYSILNSSFDSEGQIVLEVEVL
jgi:hypothetical protein